MSFYKVPQAGWLQPQKLIVPPSWRLEVKLSESAGLVSSEAVTDSLFLAFPCFCWFCWKSAAVLDYRHIIPTSVFIFTWLSPGVGVSVSKLSSL